MRMGQWLHDKLGQREPTDGEHRVRDLRRTVATVNAFAAEFDPESVDDLEFGEDLDLENESDFRLATELQDELLMQIGIHPRQKQFNNCFFRQRR